MFAFQKELKNSRMKDFGIAVAAAALGAIIATYALKAVNKKTQTPA